MKIDGNYKRKPANSQIYGEQICCDNQWVREETKGNFKKFQYKCKWKHNRPQFMRCSQRGPERCLQR